jgi:hypothetical protein
MEMVVTLALKVKVAGDRTNANEIFVAIEEAMWEAKGELAREVIEGYQERVVGVLCSASCQVSEWQFVGLGFVYPAGAAGTPL